MLTSIAPFQSNGRLASEVFRRSGLEVHMGLQLYRLFLDAGLPEPKMELISTAGGGPAWHEMHIQLKWLHKAVKCSRFFLIKAEKYLSLMETGEQQKDASS